MAIAEMNTANATGTSETGKEKLMEDLRALAADADELVKATANSSVQQIAAARVKAEDSLRAAKKRLAVAQTAIVEKGKLAAKAGDDYVRANPWRAIGIAAAVGAIVGALISRR